MAGWISMQKFFPAVTIAILMITGFLIRAASLKHCIDPFSGAIYFENPDSFEHLRRITLWLETFPRIQTFDYYDGFPKGTGQLWGPLFDYCLTAILWVTDRTPRTIEYICYFVNPVLSSLTVCTIYVVIKTWFKSTSAAIASAFLFACTPAIFNYSLGMNFDQHSLEPLILLMLFSLPLLEKTDRSSLVMAGTSLALLVSIAGWRGSTIFWGLLFLTLMLRRFISRNKIQYLIAYGKGFLIASGILGIVCYSNIFRTSDNVNFGVISWFHVIFLLTTGGLLLLASHLSTCSFWRLVSTIVLMLIAATPFLPVRHYFSQFYQGIQLLLGIGEPWLIIASEQRGIIDTYGFTYWIKLMTPLFLLSPCALILGMRAVLRNEDVEDRILTLLAWSPLLFLAFIVRYAPLAAMFGIIATGFLCSRFEKKWPQQKSLLAILVLLAYLPSASMAYEALSYKPREDYARDLLAERGGLLSWIRENTPETSYHLSPSQRPEYGILAKWSLGSLIYHVARRPAMSTQWASEAHGFFEEAAFWVMDDYRKAMELLARNSIRYVIVTSTVSLENSYSIARSGIRQSKLPVNSISDTTNLDAAMYLRLLSYGSSFSLYGPRYAPGHTVPACGNFRLLFESPDMLYKLYEVVKGATITGTATPYSAVRLTIPVMSGTTTHFSFTDRIYSDAHGTFSFTVPYATSSTSGTFTTGSHYEIRVEGKPEVKVKVSEDAVQKGLITAIGSI